MAEPSMAESTVPATIRRIAKNFSGQLGVAARDLKTGEEVLLDAEKVFPTAMGRNEYETHANANRDSGYHRGLFVICAFPPSEPAGCKPKLRALPVAHSSTNL